MPVPSTPNSQLQILKAETLQSVHTSLREVRLPDSCVHELQHVHHGVGLPAEAMPRGVKLTALPVPQGKDEQFVVAWVALAD